MNTLVRTAFCLPGTGVFLLFARILQRTRFNARHDVLWPQKFATLPRLCRACAPAFVILFATGCAMTLKTSVRAGVRA